VASRNSGNETGGTTGSGHALAKIGGTPVSVSMVVVTSPSPDMGSRQRSKGVTPQRLRSTAWQHDKHHGRRTTVWLVWLTQNPALL